MAGLWGLSAVSHESGTLSRGWLAASGSPCVLQCSDKGVYCFVVVVQCVPCVNAIFYFSQQTLYKTQVKELREEVDEKAKQLQELSNEIRQLNEER